MNFLQQFALAGQVFTALASVRFLSKGEQYEAGCRIKYRYKGEDYFIVGIKIEKG